MRPGAEWRGAARRGAARQGKARKFSDLRVQPARRACGEQPSFDNRYKRLP